MLLLRDVFRLSVSMVFLSVSFSLLSSSISSISSLSGDSSRVMHSGSVLSGERLSVSCLVELVC